jgi:RHS repeat-associated protein
MIKAIGSLIITSPSTGAPTTITFDANGNTILENAGGALTTYSWDGENRLIFRADAINGILTSTYDGKGQRESLVTPTATTLFVRDGQNILMEANGSGVTQAHHTDNPGNWGGKSSQRRSGTSSFYGFDLSSNTRMLTSASAAELATYLTDGFGLEQFITGSTANPFLFSGGVGLYRDLANWIQARARFLDARKGRWPNRDPLVQTDRGYSYNFVENNPVVRIDPSGLIAITIDDAPHSVSTLKILKALHEFNLKVAFFVIGNNVKKWNAGLIAIRAASEGHAIGNHSMSHPQPFCPPSYKCGKSYGKAPVPIMVQEWCDCHKTVKNLIGLEMNILRSPGGAGWLCCPGPVKQSIVEVNKQLNSQYREIQGSGADDNPEPMWTEIQTCLANGRLDSCPAWHQFLNEIDGAVREHKGGNIILHDSPNSPSVADFMSHVLTYIKDKWGLTDFVGR